jgi:GTPase SAR1 family protein
MTSFKVCVIGDSNVGKTVYMTRLATGRFQPDYIPSPTAETTEFVFLTNRGRYTVDIDVLRGGDYEICTTDQVVAYDAAIAIFDVTNIASYAHLKTKWVHPIPTVVCGNKVDCVGSETQALTRVVKLSQIKREIKCAYTDLSAKSCYKFEEPFLVLLKQLTKHEDLTITTYETYNTPLAWMGPHVDELFPLDLFVDENEEDED